VQILESVTDEVMSAAEKQLWQDDYEKLMDKTIQWSKKTQVVFTPEELHYMTLLENPKYWAAESLKWFARDYQEPMLQEMADSKRTVLRLGRRLGKTETMCIMILWHAFAQPNKGPNNQYDILIIAPYETQVDLIFKRLEQLIDMSGDVKPSRDVHHCIELPNGTVITGLTAGSKSGSGAANTRGQRADLIVMDEVDYMGESEITNIMNIRNEAPERIKMIVASTPSGKRDSYYKWCTGATKTYGYDEDGTAKNQRVTYKKTFKPFKTKSDGSYELNKLGHKMRDGNGWTTIHAPSTVNPELLKVNPDTGLTYIEELRADLTEMRFIQEVLAEFGESISGVFLKKHIDIAVEHGRKLKLEYATKGSQRTKKGPRILGVDWDKKKADTNMVGVEWDKEKELFIPFFRKVIPRGEFTYTNAVEAIKKAHYDFDFDYMMIDAGHGETQIEMLHIWAEKYQKGLAKTINRVNFSEKVKVWDPITKKVESKHIKPFMVNNAVFMFEREMVALNPTDKETISQFEAYEVKTWGVDGRPTYTDENEHILDCIVLALYGFTKYYDDILKVAKSAAIRAIHRPLDRMESDIKERDIEPEDPGTKQVKRVAAALGIQPNRQRNSSARRGYQPARRSMGTPRRKSF
jgi:hypothetical protein